MDGKDEKQKILIIDDNSSLLKTMSFILSRKGYDVTTASSGKEAVELSHTTEYDLIFCDIKMPDIDGVETFRRIKNERPDALVVMMTAYAVDDLIKQALAEGAYSVIYKPLDMDNVISFIENTYNNKPKGSILVIDDEPLVCNILQRQLEKNGYDVETANSGLEAIEKVRRKKYDMYFIDIVMPKMNGRQVFDALKEIQPGAIAVMMTGYIQDAQDIADRCLLDGAYTCLIKPVELAEILRLTEEIMAKKTKITKRLSR